jgi:hypothetical protein
MKNTKTISSWLPVESIQVENSTKRTANGGVLLIHYVDNILHIRRVTKKGEKYRVENGAYKGNFSIIYKDMELEARELAQFFETDLMGLLISKCENKNES